MFHPGRVVTVFNNKKDEISSDKEVQALVLMWDENMLTLPVHPKLGSKIKEDDVVLVDYRPVEKLGVPIPKQTIIKILKGKRGLALWDKYIEYHEQRKRSASRPSAIPSPGYIG